MESNMQRVSLGLMIGIMALSTIEVQAFPFPNKKEAVWMTVGIGLCALVAFPLNYWRNRTYYKDKQAIDEMVKVANESGISLQTWNIMGHAASEIYYAIADELGEVGGDLHNEYLAAAQKRAGVEVKRAPITKKDTKSNDLIPLFLFYMKKEDGVCGFPPVLAMKAYVDIGGTFKNDEVNKELV